MRAEFKATVKSMGPTALDGFVGSAHVVTLSVYGPAPIGGEYVSVDLPLFTVEHVRALGPLYGVQDAVRVTVEAGESKADRLEDEARRLRDTVASLERRAEGDTAEIERLRISVQKLTTDYKAERDAREPDSCATLRGAVGILWDELHKAALWSRGGGPPPILAEATRSVRVGIAAILAPAGYGLGHRPVPTGEEAERAVREAVDRLRASIAADNSPLPDHDSGPAAGARGDDSNGQGGDT